MISTTTYPTAAAAAAASITKTTTATKTSTTNCTTNILLLIRKRRTVRSIIIQIVLFVLTIFIIMSCNKIISLLGFVIVIVPSTISNTTTISTTSTSSSTTTTNNSNASNTSSSLLLVNNNKNDYYSLDSNNNNHNMNNNNDTNIQQDDDDDDNTTTIANNTNNVPSIAFLFIISKEHILNEELWEQWFPPKSDLRYSIYVHYGIDEGDNGSDNTNDTIIPNIGQFFCQYIIPSVPTKWYFLYNGMVQSLQTAYEQDTNAKSFIYISSTTIPLFSFNEVYNTILQQDNYGIKSRFCFSVKEQIIQAWNVTASKLNIDMNYHAKKAEMWSVVSRKHANILLNEKEIMDQWNIYYYNLYYHQKITSIGAPDELFFPTMLHMKLSNDDEFQSCTPKSSQQLTNSCCSTYVSWDPDARLYLGTNESSSLSSSWMSISENCYPKHPCTMSILREEALIELQKLGYMFLRKINKGGRYNNAYIRSYHTGQKIPLNDALIHYIHKKQLITTKPYLSTTPSKTNTDKNFHCYAPQNTPKQ